MTRSLVLFLVAFLTICACYPRTPPRHYASEVVLATDPDARCTDFYTGVGGKLVHSSVCKLSSKAVVYCTTSIDQGLKCDPLVGPPLPKGEKPQSIEPPPGSGPTQP